MGVVVGDRKNNQDLEKVRVEGGGGGGIVMWLLKNLGMDGAAVVCNLPGNGFQKGHRMVPTSRLPVAHLQFSRSLRSSVAVIGSPP